LSRARVVLFEQSEKQLKSLQTNVGKERKKQKTSEEAIEDDAGGRGKERNEE